LLAVYAIGLGIPCIITLWWFETRFGLLADYDRYAYPALLTVLGLSFLGLLMRPDRQRSIFWLAYLGLALYFIGALFSFIVSQVPARLYTVANTLQWMPLLYVGSFLFFRKRDSLAAAACVFLLALLPPAFAIVTGQFAAWDLVLGALILNAYAVHLLIILALSVFVLASDALDRFQVQAELMENAAFTDLLTGIANRRGLEQMLAHYASGPAQPVALILLDIDHFKRVNDRHGHLVGDSVLADVATVVRGQLRDTDFVGRWGGEEFLLLARNTSLEEARILADRLRTVVGANRHPVAGGVTLSAGVTLWNTANGLEAAFRNVDLALYAAKAQGRDRIATAEPGAARDSATLRVQDRV
ncbi:MAG: hypothetical protein B7Z15_18780, partial [Rhizobiales bacterium 32-66-8]